MGAREAAAVEERIPRGRKSVRLKISGKEVRLTNLDERAGMVKVKHYRSADCVVGGYRRTKGSGGVGSLLLGLYGDDDLLHHVGFTSSFSADQRLLGRALQG